tara:strand:+ start:3094 stop:3807 length:714 start_codon:yes stop_codon:yes gene_type:complete
MKFKKNKYLVCKEALSKEMTDFIYNYFLLRKKVAMTLFKENWISPFSKEWGFWNDKQVPNTYSHYADLVMETLLMKLQSLIEKKTKLKLNPNYSFARIYKKGDVLHRHKDRFSCETSATLNLGGDPWPIYISPKENVGLAESSGGKKGITTTSNAKGIKVNLKPGDMLIYQGVELEHWREAFEGHHCAQVFVHYNTKKYTETGAPLDGDIYDSRPHLGLPSDFIKNIRIYNELSSNR